MHLVAPSSDSAEKEEVQIPSIQQRIGSYKDNLAADSAPIPPSSDRIAASGQIKHICDKDTSIDNSATSPEPEVKLKQHIQKRCMALLPKKLKKL